MGDQPTAEPLAGPIRIGARTSPLARAQADLIAADLQARGARTEFVGITTQGDTDRRHLAEIAADAGSGVGTGLFAAAVRGALLDGRIDIAVHSAKDLPSADLPGIRIAAVPPREDPHDVLVGARLAELPDGARIGTGSPRRAVQLEGWAASTGRRLEIVPTRGNVDTRLGLISTGELSAVVLAAAGLRRLGRLGPGLGTYEILPFDVMLPAASQGCLAVEARTDAPPALTALLAELDDPVARTQLTAERAFLAAVEAGCLAPIGVRTAGPPAGGGTVPSAETDAADLTMTAVIGRTLVGSPVLTRLTADGVSAQAAALGQELARRLLALVDADHN